MRLPKRVFFFTSEIRDGMRNAFGKKLPRNHQILFLPHCFVWLVTPHFRPLLLKSWFDFRPSPPFNWSHVLSESLCDDLQKFKCIDELIESNSLNASLFFKNLLEFFDAFWKFRNFTLPWPRCLKLWCWPKISYLDFHWIVPPWHPNSLAWAWLGLNHPMPKQE